MLLLLVAVASGLVFYRYARDMAAARAAVAEGAKIVRTAVGTLEYGETGSGMPLISSAAGSASSRRPGSDTSECPFQLMRPLTRRRMRMLQC